MKPDATLIEDDCVALFSEFVGQAVRQIHRIHWDHRGEVNFDFGPIEVATDKSTAWFNVSGGVLLSGARGAWVDPMDDWPAEDAPRFVEQDGMYRQFDMTGSPDYACIVGHEVLAITPIREDYRDRLVGFAMTTDSGTLRAWAEGDEFWVEVRPGRTEVRVSRAPGR